MVSKLLFWMFTFGLLAKLLVLPRFRKLKERMDRVVNAVLIAIALVYGGQLLLFMSRH